MTQTASDFIVSCMTENEAHAAVQRIQTEHRLNLADFWGVENGMKILEVGCGQGDTTAVLAYLVGDEGLVHGVDLGPEDYGSPLTLGQAAAKLKASPLGKPIQMAFSCDILSEAIDFPEKSFDAVVLSNCSWYMTSEEELRSILTRTHRWSKQLFMAEWDTRLTSFEQYPHFLSVLIQAQYESFKSSSIANVRTLFTPMDLKRIATEAGWILHEEAVVPAAHLQDGKWECGMVTRQFTGEIEQLTELPERLKNLLKAEVELLQDQVKDQTVKSMNTFAFIAK